MTFSVIILNRPKTLGSVVGPFENKGVPEIDLPARVGARLELVGVDATPVQQRRLAAYIGLLTKWNKTVNLTALPLSPLSEGAIDRLIVEPLLGALLVRGWAGNWVDIGSGGGSPAIPIKISIPGLRLAMVESKARKSAFLREAIRQLDLVDSEVLTRRIEDMAEDPAIAGSIQLVSIRAVRMDDTLWRVVDQLVGSGGGVLWFRTASERFGIPQSFEVESATPTGDGDEVALLRRR